MSKSSTLPVPQFLKDKWRNSYYMPKNFSVVQDTQGSTVTVHTQIDLA